MALLTIIVLDCVVLGALHLALQEQRIGSNQAAVVQLRLDAESGARLALGLWTAEIDSMGRGSVHRLSFPVDATAGAAVSVERLDDHLFLLESTAAEPPPRVGRAAAKLLVHPPAIPPDVQPAPAPISSGSAVLVTATGVVVSGPPAGCATGPQLNGILAPPFAVMIEAGAVVDAPPGTPGSRPLTGFFDRLVELAPPQNVTPSDSTITGYVRGALIATGNVTIAAGAEFQGILVASGIVRVEAGAELVGTVHALGGVAVAGRVQGDPCIVEAVVREVGLDRPQLAGRRPWLPAF